VVAVYAGSEIAWSSQREWSFELPKTETEFIAASEGAKELLWLKRLLGELGGKGSEVPTLYVDSAIAVKLAKNPEFHKRSKHVKVLYYFVRECYQDGRIAVEHIDGLKQLADLLTKPLD
jgi:hypothetical protein